LRLPLQDKFRTLDWVRIKVDLEQMMVFK